MKANAVPCPSCRRVMIYELDRAVHRCINCAKVWTRLDLANLGYVYATSKSMLQAIKDY